MVIGCTMWQVMSGSVVLIGMRQTIAPIRLLRALSGRVTVLNEWYRVDRSWSIADTGSHAARRSLYVSGGRHVNNGFRAWWGGRP